MIIEVLPTSQLLASRAAELIAEAATAAIEESGRFCWAVSGGSTPRTFLEKLAQRDDIDWSKVHVFQVDERVAPPGSKARNSTMLTEALFGDSKLAATDLAGFWLMPVEEHNLEEASASYSQRLQRVLGEETGFDLVHLGLGDDGHTASLVPGDDALTVTNRDVAVTNPYQGTIRMTLTYPALNRAKQQLWVISGAAKTHALKQYLEQDPEIPATLVDQSRATVIVDSKTYSPNIEGTTKQ